MIVEVIVPAKPFHVRLEIEAETIEQAIRIAVQDAKDSGSKVSSKKPKTKVIEQ